MKSSFRDWLDAGFMISSTILVVLLIVGYILIFYSCDGGYLFRSLLEDLANATK